MKLRYVMIPLTIGSAAVAGWIAVGPNYVESTAQAITIDHSGQVSTGRATVIIGRSDTELDSETGYAVAAFPPTMSDREWHENAWFVNNCLDCHETGVGDAPMIEHIGLPEITWESKCRTCHVLIEGKTDLAIKDEDSVFASWAFPPMMPNNENHDQAWGKNDCLLCHDDGIRGAPVIKHKGLPRITLKAKCRTCHVQVRSHITSPWPELELPPLDE